MDTNPNYWMAGLKILGALGLLIFGMKQMSEALQKMAGPQLRHILGRMTTNRWTGIMTGIGVTAAVQSSSATTVMTVSFVSAGLLTLAQAISVIMGANIGTTLTAWIISLGYDMDLTNIVFPAFFVGMILIYRQRHRFVGDFLFGIAFMFLSLVMLSTTGKELDLANNDAVVQFFASFDTQSYLTILAFLAIGTIITCIVQSSAAVMAITIMLCSTGVLPIYLGIALVMGENIGTTATANLAALGANREARRAALAHLVFNLIGVTWVLCVFYPFVDLVLRLANGASLPVVLATFHTCFNVTNTLLLIGFVPQIEKLCYHLLPDNEEPKEPFHLQYIESNLIKTPEIAVLQAQRETARFGERMQDMFGMVKNLLQEKNDKEFTKLLNEIAYQEDYSDQMELAIANYLEQVSNAHLSDETKEKIRSMMRQVDELESVGDACYNLSNVLKRQHEDGKQYTARQMENITKMVELVDKALTQMNQVIKGHRREQNIADTLNIENAINDLRNQLKADNLDNINKREYSYVVGTLYNDFINECEKLGDYVVNVVQARLGI
ncbi:MAG: Na/Pi cotransporter family protein [Prevotella sp.]|nr:Na/Pi cotransporter family protein [Prevotella sp.]